MKKGYVDGYVLHGIVSNFPIDRGLNSPATFGVPYKYSNFILNYTAAVFVDADGQIV